MMQISKSSIRLGLNSLWDSSNWSRIVILMKKQVEMLLGRMLLQINSNSWMRRENITFPGKLAYMALKARIYLVQVHCFKSNIFLADCETFPMAKYCRKVSETRKINQTSRAEIFSIINSKTIQRTRIKPNRIFDFNNYNWTKESD